MTSRRGAAARGQVEDRAGGGSPIRAWLVIEASTPRATVALTDGRRILAGVDVPVSSERDGQLTPAVAGLLEAAGLALADVTRLICGAGPGGFTSLRIAAAVAKGMVTATGSPLASVSSLLLLVAGAVDRLHPGQYLASLDALRGERYAALISVAPRTANPCVALCGPFQLLGAEAVADWAREARATLIGPGCEIEAWPDARGVIHVPHESIVDVDVSTWEPDYGRLAEAAVKRAASSRPGA